MTSLFSYSLQALVCALIVTIFCMKTRSLDTYTTVVVAFWTIVVVGIYAHWGVDQINLYSNDQSINVRIIEQHIKFEGTPFTLDQIIGWRYLVILPVYYLSRIGFNSILLLKFQQLIYLLLTYKFGRRFLNNNCITVKYWHLMFICGPTFLFMSTLALRDLAIVYFTVLFAFSKQSLPRLVGILCVFLLRPHMAIALMFGLLVSLLYRRIKPKFFIPSLVATTLGAYALGAYSFFVGSWAQSGTSLTLANNVFSQYKFVRLGANFLSFQFLTLDDKVVSASNLTLFSSRLVFFDTFLTPSLFIFCMLQFSKKLSELQVLVFVSFIYFYGITSQTSWNSSRQNMPFFCLMGILVVIAIESRSKYSSCKA